jgi:hypothetical protein
LGTGNLTFKACLDGESCCTDSKGLDSFFSAKGVGYDVGFSKVILDVAIVIIKEFYPFALPHVKLLLAKYLLKALVAGEDCALGSI